MENKKQACCRINQQDFYLYSTRSFALWGERNSWPNTIASWHLLLWSWCVLLFLFLLCLQFPTTVHGPQGNTVYEFAMVLIRLLDNLATTGRWMVLKSQNNGQYSTKWSSNVDCFQHLNDPSSGEGFILHSSWEFKVCTFIMLLFRVTLLLITLKIASYSFNFSSHCNLSVFYCDCFVKDQHRERGRKKICCFRYLYD